MKEKKDFRTVVSDAHVIALAVFALCWMLIVTDLVPGSINGFGVDSAGKLYLGQGRRIEVWEDGEKVQTIRRGTDRGYVFTIREDDTILLASGDVVMVMDLKGAKILEKWEDPEAKTYYALREDKYEFTSASGEHYTAGYWNGPLAVRKGDTVIYQEPLWNFLVGQAAWISGLAAFISWIIEKIIKKMEDDGTGFKFGPPPSM